MGSEMCIRDRPGTHAAMGEGPIDGGHPQYPLAERLDAGEVDDFLHMFLNVSALADQGFKDDPGMLEPQNVNLALATRNKFVDFFSQNLFQNGSKTCIAQLKITKNTTKNTHIWPYQGLNQQ